MLKLGVASDAIWMRDVQRHGVWRHTRTRDSKKTKLGDQVEGVGYAQTTFYLPNLMHVGMGTNPLPVP